MRAPIEFRHPPIAAHIFAASVRAHGVVVIVASREPAHPDKTFRVIFVRPRDCADGLGIIYSAVRTPTDTDDKE